MSELRCETINNFRNSNCNPIQKVANWFVDDFSTTIGERYKRIDLHMHVHIRVGLSEFCAIFQYTESASSEDVRVCPPISDSKPTSSDSCDLDNPMLVRIVNLF